MPEQILMYLVERFHFACYFTDKDRQKYRIAMYGLQKILKNGK
jgi:hypothetical protein